MASTSPNPASSRSSTPPSPRATTAYPSARGPATCGSSGWGVGRVTTLGSRSPVWRMLRSRGSPSRRQPTGSTSRLGPGPAWIL
ncbi:unnamed protein product [Linum tenue]|uniref:Uncharacterized protein n=1 Tax=Linum tenue TaxID=586396 RepID=A0AAV0ISP1_9ROSI|nr:unnamed protein product [Linum tenue]